MIVRARRSSVLQMAVATHGASEEEREEKGVLAVAVATHGASEEEREERAVLAVAVAVAVAVVSPSRQG